MSDSEMVPAWRYPEPSSMWFRLRDLSIYASCVVRCGICVDSYTVYRYSCSIYWPDREELSRCRVVQVLPAMVWQGMS